MKRKKSVHAVFLKRASALDPKLRILCAQSADDNELASRPAGPGVYIFTERGKHLYVGRTRNIRRRYGDHTRPSSKENQAGFAVLLALKEVRAGKATYVSATSRAKIYEKRKFKAAFKKAKQRVRKMQFRFVEIEDSTDQALLEIYCAIALKTPHNDFATH